MSTLTRNLIVTVVALAGLSALAIVLFDTTWWGILIGFNLAIAWVLIYSLALAKGIGLLPSSLRREPSSADPSLNTWVVPIWVALVLLWFAAGWFITNGGG